MLFGTLIERLLTAKSSVSLQLFAVPPIVYRNFRLQPLAGIGVIPVTSVPYRGLNVKVLVSRQ